MPNTIAINKLVEDQEFLKLPEGDQNKIITQLYKSSPGVGTIGVGNLPKGDLFTEGGRKTTDSILDFLGPIVSGLGATAAVGLTKSPAAGAAAYTAINSLKQYLQRDPQQSFGSEVLGLEKGGIPSNLVDTAQQAAFDYGGGRVINKAIDIRELFKTGGIGPFTRSTEVAKKAAGLADDVVNKTSQFVDRDPAAMFKAIADDIPRESSANFAKAFPGVTSPSAAPMAENFLQLDELLKSGPKIESMLTKANAAGNGSNLRKDIQSYYFTRAWQNATTRDAAGKVVIDTAKLNDAFFQHELQDAVGAIYGPKTVGKNVKTMFSQQNRADIEQFIKNVGETQAKKNTSGFPSGSRFWIESAGVGLPVGLVSGHLSYGGVATGIVLGGHALAKLLTNAKTARTMVNLAGGQPLERSSQAAGRAIASVLQGSMVTVLNADGSSTPVRVEGETLVPVQPQQPQQKDRPPLSFFEVQ